MYESIMTLYIELWTTQTVLSRRLFKDIATVVARVSCERVWLEGDGIKYTTTVRRRRHHHIFFPALFRRPIETPALLVILHVITVGKKNNTNDTNVWKKTALNVATCARLLLPKNAEHIVDSRASFLRT